MLAGISASYGKCETIILEKMNTCGKKIRITGKGRCNITNSADMSEFIANIPGNGKFLYSSFQAFTNQDIIQLLNEEGLKTKIERGNRVFPVTDDAQSVIDTLMRILKRQKVTIVTNAEVTDICVKDGIAKGVQYIKNGIEKEITADKVILATGGVSYPNTGSTGDGYKIAQKYRTHD